MPTRLRRRDLVSLSAAYLLVLQVLFSSVLIATVEASSASHYSFGAVQLCSGALLEQGGGAGTGNKADRGALSLPHCPVCLLNPSLVAGVLPPSIALPGLSETDARVGQHPDVACLASSLALRPGARAPPHFS